jgi:hypothetical protein
MSNPHMAVLLCHPAPTDQPTRSPYSERAPTTNPEQVPCRERLAIDKVLTTMSEVYTIISVSEAECRPSHRALGNSSVA